MQIMPTSHTGNAAANSSRSSRSDSRDERDFMKMLTDALQDTPAEISPVLDAVPGYSTSDSSRSSIPFDSQDSYDSDNDPANSAWSTVEAPYSTAPTTLETPPEDTPLEEIRFTDSELADVIKDLRKQGVDDETLARVAELMNRPGGTTAKEIHTAVMGNDPAKLTDADLQRIASFLDRVDPSGQLKTGIMDDLKAGRTFKVTDKLNSIMEGLAKEGASLNMDKGEILSLGKALRLGDDAMKSLEKAFGGKDSLKLGATEARDLLAPLLLEIQKQQKNMEKAVDVLATALKPAVDKARARLKAEADAAGQRSRRTEQSEMLIRDTVTREGVNKTAETASRTEGTPAEGNAADKVRDRLAAKAEDGNQTGSQAGKEGADKAAKAKADKAEDAKFDPLADAKSTTKKEDPWDALLRKLEVRTEQPVVRTETPQPLTVASSLGMQSASQAAQAGQQTARATGHMAAKVLSQVEQGVLSALADGTKRMTLNLNPVELGAVSVILSSRNGEVSAILKPERPETAAMMTQQADVLRHTLEQQGIKVDKVEVQTPQDQRSNEQWQGMDQHNASHEQQTRRDALDRMRRLGQMREAEPVTVNFSSSAQAMRHAARPTTSLSVIA